MGIEKYKTELLKVKRPVIKTIISERKKANIEDPHPKLKNGRVLNCLVVL